MNENKTNIHWYPGHMAKTKKIIAEKNSLIDIVYELVDARIPYSSKISDIDSLVKNKMDEFVVYEFPNSGIEALSKSSYSGFMIKNEEEKVAIQIWNSGINMCAVKSFTDDQAQISSSLKTEEDCN